MLNIYKIPDLTDGGHCLAAAGATYDKDVIFQRYDSLTLLSIERICQDCIEILTATGKLIHDETLIICLLMRPCVRHGSMETLECLLIGRLFQFFAVEERFNLSIQRVVFFCQHQALGLCDVVAEVVVFANFRKRDLYIRFNTGYGLQAFLMLFCLLFGPDGNHHPKDDGNN